MPRSEVTVTSKDFQRAGKALERGHFSATVAKPLNTAIRKSANVARNNIRVALGPHRRTGKMRGRVRVKVTGRGLDTVGKVLTGAGSNLIVGGVRPHPIVSATPMPLWGGRGKGAGITGFATAVEHPGFGADPYVDKGIARSQGDIQNILDAAGQALVAALAESMR